MVRIVIKVSQNLLGKKLKIVGWWMTDYIIIGKFIYTGLIRAS